MPSHPDRVRRNYKDDTPWICNHEWPNIMNLSLKPWPCKNCNMEYFKYVDALADLTKLVKKF